MCQNNGLVLKHVDNCKRIILADNGRIVDIVVWERALLNSESYTIIVNLAAISFHNWGLSRIGWKVILFERIVLIILGDITGPINLDTM